MKLIPSPEPGDTVKYLGEGEVEQGLVRSVIRFQASWRLRVDWELPWGERDAFVWANWNEELKLWVTT